MSRQTDSVTEPIMLGLAPRQSNFNLRAGRTKLAKHLADQDPEFARLLRAGDMDLLGSMEAQGNHNSLEENKAVGLA